jgi:hypothetical protein
MRRKAAHAPFLLPFIKPGQPIQGKSKLSGKKRSCYLLLPNILAASGVMGA